MTAWWTSSPVPRAGDDDVLVGEVEAGAQQTLTMGAVDRVLQDGLQAAEVDDAAAASERRTGEGPPWVVMAQLGHAGAEQPLARRQVLVLAQTAEEHAAATR